MKRPSLGITTFTCARCLCRQHLRRAYAVQSGFGSNEPQPLPPPLSGAVKLTNRNVVLVSGRDAAKFLQGLITNDVLRDFNNGYFAALLNAQGKLLNDLFVYPVTASKREHVYKALQSDGDDPSFFLDVDKISTDALRALLTKHKLRSKVKFHTLASEVDVWNIWRESDRWTAHGKQSDLERIRGEISLVDSRAPGMGRRMLVPTGEARHILGDIEEAPMSAYKIRRYLRGVPEGQEEMPSGEVLPMNCNVDLMSGIDFKKGCYNGQELTIRTHHTGVVRRRILPIALYDQTAGPPETLEYDSASKVSSFNVKGIDIRRDDARKRSTGSLIASVSNIGLGMCRLEAMTNLVVSGDGSSFTTEDRFMAEGPSGTHVGVKAFVPDWLRGQIRTPKMQRRVE